MAAEAAVSTAVLELADLLTQKANFLRGSVIGEVEQLRDALKGVQCFLSDVADKQADVATRDWIYETGEVAHNAELAVEVFISEVERARMMLASFASSLNHNCIRKRLHGIERRRYLGDRSNRSRRLAQWQKDKHVVGMEKEAELVLEKAILDEGGSLTISCIGGMGGFGKSTLARTVYNHPSVADRFERRAWAVASKEVKPRDIVKELYLQVKTPEATEWEVNHLDTLELSELHAMLHYQLRGKRYLIVLDAMREDVGLHLGIAKLSCFVNEGTRSRILITLRASHVRDHGAYVHMMKYLDSDESWKLFLNTVLSDGNFLEEDLEYIGRQIVKKCDGLPLAITLVGGLLMKQSRSRFRWEKFLQEMNYLLNRRGKDAIQAVLELSYEYLPPQLKTCFLCLGFFRADCIITAQKLVDIWISLGFIPQEGGKAKEETARAYLEELVDRNMIQIKDISIDDSIKRCVMHDLVRDLSIRKAWENNPECWNKPPHHVLDCSEGRFTESSCGNEHVRSLVVRGDRPYLLSTLVSSYWTSFQLLRVLDFEGCLSMRELPASIGALIGLRYLCLRNTGMSCLPEWLPRLIYLEVLDIRGLVNVEMSDIVGKMYCLRHLYASSLYFKMPLEINGLSSLQTLCYVSFNDEDIEQVTYMSSLSKLGIKLYQISDSWRLFDLLEDMENLVHLKLDICHNLNLDGLGALHCVRRLKLHHKIPVLPSIFPPNLSHLTLDGCRLKEDPMLLLKDLPELSYLKLDNAYEGMDMVIWNDGFHALEVLVLRCLRNLVGIRVEEGAMLELRRLEINRCPCLESFPEEMRNLEELRIVASKKIATKLRGADFHTIGNVAYVQIVDDLALDEVMEQ